MTQHDPARASRRIRHAASLREQVEAAISARVVAGEFQPGEVLTVPTLAAEFGVSATPVREAMLELVRRGFLSPLRNKGFQVTEVTIEELRAITAVRQLLEAPPMRQLAGTIDPVTGERLHELAATIMRSYEERDFQAYIEADTRFHLSLLELTGNPRLVELVADLRAQTRLVGLVRGEQDETMRRAAAEHQELLGLLIAGDGEGAEVLMRRHVGHVAGIWSGHEEVETAEPRHP